MSVTPTAIEEVRERAQDFSIPYHFEYTIVVYKKSDHSSTRSMYLMPFKWNVSSSQKISLGSPIYFQSQNDLVKKI